MNYSHLKEISRIVIGIIALRIVQNGESVYFEKFDSNKWAKISSSQIQELFSNKEIRKWLEKHSDLIKN
jgi:hypothetical protein